MSVMRPPPMYIRASCVRVSLVQRPRRGEGYGALATMGARGDVAEWLGRGLQSLVQRFESARRLDLRISRTFSSRVSGTLERGEQPVHFGFGPLLRDRTRPLSGQLLELAGDVGKVQGDDLDGEVNETERENGREEVGG